MDENENAPLAGRAESRRDKSNRSTTRAERLTPERYSKGEVLRAIHLGVRTGRQLRLLTSQRRLTRLDPEALYSTSEVGFFLGHGRYFVGERIRNGELPARWIEKPDGPRAYRILGRHVLELAAELDAAVSSAEERRLETVRAESFEGRAGSWR